MSPHDRHGRPSSISCTRTPFTRKVSLVSCRSAETRVNANSFQRAVPTAFSPLAFHSRHLFSKARVSTRGSHSSPWKSANRVGREPREHHDPTGERARRTERAERTSRTDSRAKKRTRDESLGKQAGRLPKIAAQQIQRCNEALATLSFLPSK